MVQAFFGDRGNPSFRAIAYWDWLVRNVRRFGRQFPDNYCEIHVEDLVNCPSKTLQQLGMFLEEQLDWEIIQRVGIGAVSWPNSFFTEEGNPSIFPPRRPMEEDIFGKRNGATGIHCGRIAFRARLCSDH